jgi:hypothetical protein
MPDIEHDPVTLADRPFVQVLGFDGGEEGVRNVTRVDQALD